jgi:hypothetical protein
MIKECGKRRQNCCSSQTFIRTEIHQIKEDDIIAGADDLRLR